MNYLVKTLSNLQIIYFTRDVNKIKSGRCSYQFACYHDGGMITDGVMLHFKDKLWMAQADGDLINWYLAHSKDFDVKINDPNVWVSQIQGPKSLDLLHAVIDNELNNHLTILTLKKVSLDGEEVIISRTGFSNDLDGKFIFNLIIIIKKLVINFKLEKNLT